MCSPRTTLGDTRPPPHLEATNQGPEASRPTSTPLLLRRLAEGTCMGVRAPPYSSELSQRPARRRIGQGVVQSDPNMSTATLSTAEPLDCISSMTLGPTDWSPPVSLGSEKQNLLGSTLEEH